VSNTLHTHIEDALKSGPSAADPDVVLEDEQLRSGGLVPVHSWVRTKATRNALRVKRSREKAENDEEGSARKQISLLAPPDEDSRKALHELGKRMISGQVSTDDLRKIGTTPSKVESYEEKLGRRALHFMKNGGVKGRLLKYILG
jgi:hypothetical protein